MFFMFLLISIYLLNNVIDTSMVITIKKRKYYEPVWNDLDTRPIPRWFNDATIGVFIHWGLYSVPSYGGYEYSSEWFWAYWKDNMTKYVNYMESNFRPGFEYEEFNKDFTAELFNAEDWATLIEKSGAKYIVLTSKHHEGFTMFPSKYSPNWNSFDLRPHKDVVGELSEAVRHKGIKFGVYYSLYEWFNPLYLSDSDLNYTTQEFPQHKMIPEMKYLVKTYKPEVFWADGDWEATDEYFQSKEFIAWLYNDSPVRDTIVVNDRWGQGIPCHHGDFFDCKDRFNPGKMQFHKWESTVTFDKYSWGFRREANITDYITIENLITSLVKAVSCGGNFLMNIGPAKDGTISPIMQERLLQVGDWLKQNGEAIYGSRPWIYQNETKISVWYTSNNIAVYAIFLQWPTNNKLELKRIWKLFTEQPVAITMITGSELEFVRNDRNKSITIKLPDKATIKVQWAWVIKIQN